MGKGDRQGKIRSHRIPLPMETVSKCHSEPKAKNLFLHRAIGKSRSFAGAQDDIHGGLRVLPCTPAEAGD
jgi:hypothetical protein